MKSGLTEPFKMFNDLKGKFTVIAARPDVEDTYFMVDIINNCVGRKLYFNLKSERELLKDRIKVNDVELITVPITIEDINIMCEAMINYGLRTVLIDYLELVGTKDKYNNFVAQQLYIVNELKRIAQDYNISVVVLSTLPRYIDQREDKIPRLNDVKTYIRFKADVLIFLYKENYLTMLNIAKSFNNSFGTIDLHFDIEDKTFIFLGTNGGRLSWKDIFKHT